MIETSGTVMFQHNVTPLREGVVVGVCKFGGKGSQGDAPRERAALECGIRQQIHEDEDEESSNTFDWCEESGLEETHW